jgi:hypothetical protein
MARAPVAATNKLSYRLSTLPVADFSASSNVKCRAREVFRSLDLTSKRHLKELRLDSNSLPLLKKISDGRGQSLIQ